jgi:hypothetical protein
MPDKSNSSEESKPTESSKAETFPEPRDIGHNKTIRTTTPGNETGSRKNKALQKSDPFVPEGAFDEDAKRSIDEGQESAA